VSNPPIIEGSGHVDRNRVTVVVPTYNRREGVLRCLRGAFGACKGVREVTFHVVDDGSDDGTPDALVGLKSERPTNVKLHLHQQDHGGAGAARNTGFRAADTDLVVFLDDDCVPEPGWLQPFLDAPWEKGLGGVGGKIVSPTQDGPVARYCRHIGMNEFPSGADTQGLGSGEGSLNFINTANCAYRRECLEAVGGFEPLFTGAGGEDHDLAWRVCLLGTRLAYCPDSVVSHYHREDLEGFKKAFRTRGSAMTLLGFLWGREQLPPPAELRRIVRKSRLSLLELLVALVPYSGFKYFGCGVRGEDCLLFPVAKAVQDASRREGRASMLCRIARGEQSLERTTPVPTGDPGEAPKPWWTKPRGKKGNGGDE
jgi:GT2 family glycosyltransferase